jgi:rRNA maturation protein Rpf1
MFTAMNDKNKIEYKYYLRVPNEEEKYIGSLTERRKNPKRITKYSIMNYAKRFSISGVFEGRVYFVRVEI